MNPLSGNRTTMNPRLRGRGPRLIPTSLTTLGVSTSAFSSLLLASLSFAATPDPALDQLQDIIPPEPIGPWPWAIGYWLALTLTISLCLAGLSCYRKRHTFLAPKKAARQRVNSLDRQAVDYPSEVNSLLKRTALSYLPRSKIAKLDGSAWATWLDSRLAADLRGRIGPLLDMRHQGRGLTDAQAEQLHLLVNAWFASNAPFLAPEAVSDTGTLTPAETCSRRPSPDACGATARPEPEEKC